jgi:hypothetical protein
MALVSTFELLRAPQLPRNLTNRFPALQPLTRNFIQGYFLSIANLTPEIRFYSLILNPSSPIEEKDFVLSLLNTFAGAEPVSEEIGKDGRIRFDFNVNAGETALIILIPDLLNPELPEAYDLRGFIELFLRPDAANNQSPTAQVLANAEHRSTYYDDKLQAIGEQASSIALAEGRALITIDTLTGWQQRA